MYGPGPHRNHLGDGGAAEDHAPDVLAQAPGRIHQLWRQLDQLPPTLGIYLVPEGGKLQHLLFEFCAVVGVDLLGEDLKLLSKQP